MGHKQSDCVNFRVQIVKNLACFSSGRVRTRIRTRAPLRFHGLADGTRHVLRSPVSTSVEWSRWPCPKSSRLLSRVEKWVGHCLRPPKLSSVTGDQLSGTCNNIKSSPHSSTLPSPDTSPCYTSPFSSLASWVFPILTARRWRGNRFLLRPKASQCDLYDSSFSLHASSPSLSS